MQNNKMENSLRDKAFWNPLKDTKYIDCNS